MKIAVYAIALNEEQFVKRWHESAKEADYLYILDTGSTDKTVALAESLGIKVGSLSIKPWRFDHARNASLDALPEDVDYCIALDMDEVLVPGWRQQLEATPQGVTRPRYSYTWSWNEDGTPGLVYGGDKIHARKDYYWKHPVHEVITCQGGEVQHWIGLEIHHHPDNTKSRSQYFPLLELAITEDPEDDRNSFYYARELYFHSKNEAATTEFKRHLSLPRAQWAPERAASMRYLAKLNPRERESWLLRACAESPEMREPWVDLAQYYHDVRNWSSSLAAAQRALTIKEKPLAYLNEAFAWGATPLDLAARSCWQLGYFGQAFDYGFDALVISPDDEQLNKNFAFYCEKVAA